MDNHQLYNNGSVVQFSTSWHGCAIEKNMDYLWNDLNNGLEDKQPDVVSCLYFCKAMEAKYFSWTGKKSPCTIKAGKVHSRISDLISLFNKHINKSRLIY